MLREPLEGGAKWQEAGLSEAEGQLEFARATHRALEASYWEEQIRESKPSRLNDWKFAISRRMRAALLAGLTLLSVAGAEAGTTKKLEKEAAKVVDARKVKPFSERLPKMAVTEKADKSRAEKPWDWHLTFVERGEDGKPQFSLHKGLSLIAPFEVEDIEAVEERKVTEFQIPYEYARQFDSSEHAKKPVRPEDQEKLSAYIDEQLKEEFKDSVQGLWGMSFPREVTEAKHPEFTTHHRKVTDIEIVGTASPEGPARKGPETLKPGAVDEENVALALRRALGTSEVLRDRLEKMGMTVDQIVEQTSKFTGEELQFTAEDEKVLTELEKNFNGVDEAEKRFNLVRGYNLLHRMEQGEKLNAQDGAELEKFTEQMDSEKIKKLDDIIASKRKVIVRIATEGEHKETKSYPIPFPLLLALLLIRWRPKVPPPWREAVRERVSKLRGGRGPGPAPDKVVLSGKEKLAREVSAAPLIESAAVAAIPVSEISSASTPAPEKQRLVRSEISELVKLAGLPEMGGFDYQDMEERTYVDDMWPDFDNAELKRKGGENYRELADLMFDHYDEFENNEERINFLADRILDMWMRNDIEGRREAGWSDNIEDGLDYKNQPRQIQWGKMHAKGILDAVWARRDNQTYEAGLTGIVSSLIKQRGNRRKQRWFEEHQSAAAGAGSEVF